MKKIYILIFSIFCFLLPFSVNALEVEIQSSNMILYNLNDDTIIASKDEDEQISIASMTKIMTTLVAIEHITNMDEQVTLTSDVFRGLVEANASVAGFRLGQKVTYRDLLYGTFLPSGADATNALALFLAGGQEQFVAWMNEKAQSLGLTHTHFVNTSGLDVDGHYSTVKDVASMLKEALKNETFREIFQTKSYLTSDKSMTFYSTLGSSLTKFHLKADYILGAKTGYTYDAGRCLASIAYDQNQDIYYLLVTARAPITPAYYHLTDAITIYEYYFQNYGYQKIFSQGDILFHLKTKSAKEKEYPISIKEDFLWYLKNDYQMEDVTYHYDGIEIITPFMEAGTKLGTIHLYYQQEEIGTIPIVLENALTFSLVAFLLEHLLLVVITLFVIICLFLFFCYQKKLKKNHKRLRLKIRKKVDRE